MISKKRILILVISLLMLICSIVSFTACGCEETKTVTSISVAYTQGDKVIYTNTSHDEIKESLVVTVEYSDGTTETTNGYILTGTLVEGETVLTVSYEGHESTFTVNVTAATAEPHLHTLARTKAKKASCTESGNIEYWTCSTCGKYYFDKDGVTEITLEETVTAPQHSGGSEIRNSKSPTKLVLANTFSRYPKFPLISKRLLSNLPDKIASASTSVHPFSPVLKFAPKFQFSLSIHWDSMLFNCPDNVLKAKELVALDD